jgi:hypothetical protein
MQPALPSPDPAAEAIMRHALGGAIRTQAIYVAAKLGVADRLTLGPQPAAVLAEQVHADASMLQRVLRFLVTHGIFQEAADGRFALNSVAEFLQTAHPRSLRPSAIRAGEGSFEVARGLLAAVQSGVTPHREIRGAAFFEDLTARGKDVEFAARMSSSAAGLGAAIAEYADFSRASILDVGGGSGSVLLPILERHPQLQGVVFDAAVEAARQAIARSGSADRCKVIAGDFFEASLPRADVYLLSWILHDWDDASAQRLLYNCRCAGGPAATLLIVEVLLPQRAQQLGVAEAGLLADPFTLDLQMLLLTGGRERTLSEYRQLLAAADYSITRSWSLPSCRGASLIEARLCAQE